MTTTIDDPIAARQAELDAAAEAAREAKRIQGRPPA